MDAKEISDETLEAITPASADLLVIYDTSTGTTGKAPLADIAPVVAENIDIADLPTVTPAADDVLMIRDTSAGTTGKATLEQMFYDLIYPEQKTLTLNFFVGYTGGSYNYLVNVPLPFEYGKYNVTVNYFDLAGVVRLTSGVTANWWNNGNGLIISASGYNAQNYINYSGNISLTFTRV